MSAIVTQPPFSAKLRHSPPKKCKNSARRSREYLFLGVRNKVLAPFKIPEVLNLTDRMSIMIDHLFADKINDFYIKSGRPTKSFTISFD